MPYKVFVDKKGRSHRWFNKPTYHREGHKELGQRLGKSVDDIAKWIEDNFEVPADRVQIRVKGIRIIKPETLAKMRARGKMLYDAYGPGGAGVLKNFKTMSFSEKQQIARNAALARSMKAERRLGTWKGGTKAYENRRMKKYIKIARKVGRFNNSKINQGLGYTTGPYYTPRENAIDYKYPYTKYEAPTRREVAEQNARAVVRGFKNTGLMPWNLKVAEDADVEMKDVSLYTNEYKPRRKARRFVESEF